MAFVRGAVRSVKKTRLPNGNTFIEIDRGLNDEIKNNDLLDNSYTKVGYPKEGKLAAPERRRGGCVPAGDMSEIIQVAAVHEWGAPRKNIPARPTVRPSYDKSQKELQRFKERIYTQVMDGKMPVDQGLGLIGEWMAARTKKEITNLRVPPLKPATIRRKKSDNPLVDTGQMRASVQHVEVLGKDIRNM